MVLKFPILADYAAFWLGDLMVWATHGHVYNMNNLPPFKKGDVLLHGHTHIPAAQSFGDGYYYIRFFVYSKRRQQKQLYDFGGKNLYPQER